MFGNNRRFVVFSQLNKMKELRAAAMGLPGTLGIHAVCWIIKLSSLSQSRALTAEHLMDGWFWNTVPKKLTAT
jgi:hypothetical protein